MSLAEPMPIQLPDGSAVEDDGGPLVLIGANGVGKTRLGTQMARQFSYDRVPALRSLSFDQTIPMQRLEDARRDANSLINQVRTQPWLMTQEINSLLSELKADDTQSATAFRDLAEAGNAPARPEETQLKKLMRLWKRTFPGRELNLSTYLPKTKWSFAGRSPGEYDSNNMSDGERVALYLIARVLRASPGPIIIDEPEVHFHSLLAKSFWDTLETERADCRFIYITHDLPFALSRRNARIGIVKSETAVQLVAKDAPIPSDVFEGIIGAASLSVVAQRIVFCEGTIARSVDIRFFGSWFRSPSTVVVPVGGCSDVAKSVAVFKNNPAITNANAIGIVDRDYWSASYLDNLAAIGIHVLPAHEVEGLMAVREVAAAISSHLGIANFDSKYAAFEAAVRDRFKGVVLNKQILERTKRVIDERLLGLANVANPQLTLTATRATLVAAVDLHRAVPDVGVLFDEQQKIVEDALAKSASAFLAILPGKDCLDVLARQLGVTKERYIELVNNALSQPRVSETKAFEKLSTELEAVLFKYLPPRE